MNSKPPVTRICRKCRQEKPFEEFHAHAPSLHGRMRHCKACHNAHTKKMRARDAVHPLGRARGLWFCAQTRAAKRGLEFSITLEWVASALAQGTCAVTGLPFDFALAGSKGGRHPFTPSLDRIDPRKGYTPENTQAVVWLYNAAKSTATHADVLRMAQALIGRAR